MDAKYNNVFAVKICCVLIPFYRLIVAEYNVLYSTYFECSVSCISTSIGIKALKDRYEPPSPPPLLPECKA